MPNRLEPLNLTSFVGGLNLRRNQFQLGEFESPNMLNVDIDPRGGFYTRRGWQRWNSDDITDVSPEAPWKPRNAAVHNLADGTQIVYVVTNGILYAADEEGAFTVVEDVIGGAFPHQIDFSAWGDFMYMACGLEQPGARRFQEDAAVTLTVAGWSEYDAPVHDEMPHCEYIAGHAGYLFCAVTMEDDVVYPSRVRWSHFNKPDSWRSGDYLDIETGGGRITGIVSFQDQLLIFKTDSMWALYGYDEDSWQLVKVSRSVGCPCITAASRSETAVFFYSASDRGGIFAYAGEEPIYISEQLRPAMEDIVVYENVWVSWANRRLWVSVPWRLDVGATVDPSTLFVFDADIGDGAWTMYRSDVGAVAPVIDGSDVNTKFPLAAFWSQLTSAMVTLDAQEGAYDALIPPISLAVTGGEEEGYLVTGEDEEIGVEIGPTGGLGFESYYYTRWLHAGWPDRKKSWRRPTFICRQPDASVELLVESYRDYDESNPHRTRTLRVPAEGSAYWTETGYEESAIGGFDWAEAGADNPRGANWGAATRGSKIVRAGSMGLARAIQMRITASPNTPRQRWGVDAIVGKYVLRRFR